MLKNENVIKFMTLLGFSVVNLLFMYLYFICEGLFVRDMFPPFTILYVLCNVIFDVSVLYVVILFLTWGRLRFSINVVFVLTLLWSFANVFYSRFFFQSLTVTSLVQVGSLFDGVVINCIPSGFRLVDLLYILSILLYIYANKRIRKIDLSKKQMVLVCLLPIVSVLSSCVVFISYSIINPKYRSNTELLGQVFDDYVLNPMNRRFVYPNNAFVYSGSIRFLVSDLISELSTYNLSNQDLIEINNNYKDHELRITSNRKPPVKNVIFILLESFLSKSSDLVVNGKEITPFLNSLKRDSNVYYNGTIKSNVTIGQSGDGQFTYMTGLLPLRSKVTVGVAKNRTLVGFPKLLKEKCGIKHTEIVIPTSPIMWEQKYMNKQYGIDHMYSAVDGGDVKQVDEKSVFSIAMNNGIQKKQPFFQMILGISTHEPYDEAINGFRVANKEYSEEFCNYLSACHYVDHAIEGYFKFLKQNGLYDNSLIVIVSDHCPPLRALNMKNEDGLAYMPLYIVNCGKDNASVHSWEGNSLDVYTTLLDLLNINNCWLGLGHTLLSNRYVNSVNDSVYNLSEKIILGDYFRNAESQ